MSETGEVGHLVTRGAWEPGGSAQCCARLVPRDTSGNVLAGIEGEHRRCPDEGHPASQDDSGIVYHRGTWLMAWIYFRYCVPLIQERDRMRQFAGSIPAPVNWGTCEYADGFRREMWECESCHATWDTKSGIAHKPGCLYIRAQDALRAEP